MGKSLASLLVLGLILLVGQAGNLPLPQGGAPITVPHVESSVCKSDPKDHVYNPDRLTLVDPCIQVTGTIEVIRNEPDGDYHILLKLDPDFENLVNDGNKKLQRGDLVLEPVCELTVTQADAVSSCVGFSSDVPKPTVGAHVVVIGPYVLDTEHSDWAEIHPAWRIDPI